MLSLGYIKTFGSRFLAGVISLVMLISPFGIGKNAKLDQKPGEAKVIEVKADGAYETVEAARDYIRTLDKSKYSGITVKIAAGEYNLAETVEFTEEDSGTAECPITYVGEDGALITGGVYLTAKDFVPASGETASYFPADAKEHIVMADLSAHGITGDYVKELYALDEINYNAMIPVYVGGALATVARYPNEGYVAIQSGEIYLSDESADKVIDQYRIRITLEDEVIERIQSWHDMTSAYSISWHSALWRPNNYRIHGVEGNAIRLPYARDFFNEAAVRTYTPKKGMPMFFRNIPEELDMPGEYYVDTNGILYLYKTDDFADTHVTLPAIENAFSFRGADYITVENLAFEGFRGDILEVEADYFTLKGCDLAASKTALKMVGNHNLIEGCDFHDLQFGGIKVSGGDCDSLTSSETVITNNKFHDWGQIMPYYEPAINIDKGCGVTVSHNEIYDGQHEAVTWTGNNNIFEYNEVYNVCYRSDDCGCFYSYMSYADYGNVFRYNYIHDIGLHDEFFKNIEDYVYCGTQAIYFDGGKSGQTVYGNIIENIDGVGVAASGRDEIVRNNLFISCGWGIDMVACYYAGTFDSGSEQTNAGAQGLYNLDSKEAWKKAFPSLYTLNWDNPDPDDPNFYGAPAGNVVKDNYFYFDMANIKSLKWYGHVFQNHFHPSVAKFCGDNVVDAVEGVNQTTYTSKRTPIIVEEAIEATKDITGITLELFEQIGLSE